VAAALTTFWIVASDLPNSAGPPVYQRLNVLLEGEWLRPVRRAGMPAVLRGWHRSPELTSRTVLSANNLGKPDHPELLQPTAAVALRFSASTSIAIPSSAWRSAMASLLRRPTRAPLSGAFTAISSRRANSKIILDTLSGDVYMPTDHHMLEE
jgi:hypothetical protein